MKSEGDYSKMSTEPENNIFFFCVIAQGSVPCFFKKKSKTSHNSHFEKKCISIIITSHGVIIARYDVILDQSECTSL